MIWKAIFTLKKIRSTICLHFTREKKRFNKGGVTYYLINYLNLKKDFSFIELSLIFESLSYADSEANVNLDILSYSFIFNQFLILMCQFSDFIS